MATRSEVISGFEWGGGETDEPLQWPDLPDACDGISPDRQRGCILPGGHPGHHRDGRLQEWLENGLETP